MPRRLPRNEAIDAKTRKWVKVLVRVEMTRRGMSYVDLAGLLTAIGLEENARNIRSKVSRGEMPAATLLAILHVMKCSIVDVEQLIRGIE